MRIPETPEPFQKALASDKGHEKQELAGNLLQLIASDLGKDLESEYLHWEALKYKPLPEGISSHKEWWYLKKLRRWNNYRQLPLWTKSNEPFVYWIPDPLNQKLHEVDQQASGRVQFAADVTNPASRDRYLVNSLIEEAITSSQLEGASTTHKVAKAMLREQRQPRNKGERMIFNNYRAMNFVREVAHEPLSKEIILDLHRIVTSETLDDPGAAGRLRIDSEDIAVHDSRDNTILHEPPKANELEERIKRVCAFANSTVNQEEFLHPVVRSIILHFMIGYDHPFVDGNGRTARALFYWSMAKHDYWMMEYVSISTIIKSGPIKYARAYLYSETDDNDLTYFLDFNLRVIVRAIESLQKYLARKARELRSVEEILGSSALSNQFNHRQLAVISHALRNPNASYTIERHRTSHQISYPTARTDLLRLAEMQLLIQRKVRNAFVFSVADKIEVRLEELKENYS